MSNDKNRREADKYEGKVCHSDMELLHKSLTLIVPLLDSVFEALRIIKICLVALLVLFFIHLYISLYVQFEGQYFAPLYTQIGKSFSRISMFLMGK